MTAAPSKKREQLVDRLRELESEFSQIQGQLSKLAAGEALPGQYLVLEVGDRAAAVPATRVREIVRLVAWTPLPNAPSHVLGTFLYRGEPAIAVDLSAFLGHAIEPSVDAHVVLVEASQLVALVVDRVRSLVEAPLVAEAQSGDGLSDGWLNSPIVAGLARAEGELIPILNLEPLLKGVEAR